MAKNNPVSYFDIFGLKAEPSISVAFGGFLQGQGGGEGSTYPELAARYATIYAWYADDKVLKAILGKVENYKDGIIDGCDVKVAIKIGGYSWGGTTAAWLAERLYKIQQNGGTIGMPGGGGFLGNIRVVAKDKLDVAALAVLDPVGSLRPNSEVHSNVQQFINFYQQFGIRGPLPNITFRGMSLNGGGVGNIDVTGEYDSTTPDHVDLGFRNFPEDDSLWPNWHMPKEAGYAYRASELLK